MEIDFSSFDENKTKYEKALSDDLFSVFPELKPISEMRYFGQMEHQSITRSQALLSNENYKYANTDYFYKNELNKDLEFVHFTSYEALLAILEYQTFRFTSLNSVNDPNEIKFAAKLFEYPLDLINEHTKSMMSFSSCEYYSNDPEIGINTKNLDLWRFYGKDGNGVAIKFHIANNPMHWLHYHLCEIKYGDGNLSKWSKLNEVLKVFNSKYPEFYMHLIKLFAFHKSKLYQNEQEVRLIFSSHFHKPTDSLLHRYIEVDNTKYPRIELMKEGYFNYHPLKNKKNTKAQSFFLETAPQIVIDEIVLSHRLSNEEFKTNQDHLYKILTEQGGQSESDVNIKQSEIGEYYR